ncbi:hypothetical protein BROUX41_003022 [Berkeleyomyces rouxiae]|uniref:uncharacterized protein n=1 Tax=Berkeleyomyces rouxiae TaxID=2035830 RepID=UPI003B763A83
MATATRQPFAPLDSTRLQTLTSLKNRQNSVTSTPPSVGKRKAVDIIEGDDFENVDPAVFSKRSKISKTCSTPSKEPAKDIFKPSVPAAKPSPAVCTPRSVPASSPRIRSVKQTKSPISKLSTSLNSSPLSPPAGRSPTRGLKRTGLSTVYHRRAASSLGRINTSISSRGSVKAAPFSLDAALKGTIPGFSGLAKSKPIRSPLSSTAASPAPAAQTYSAIYLREYKPSWDFVIYEDTPQEHATNMLQHSTCVLDLSSDDETRTRVNKDRAEGRDKENVPPVDDVSQTSNTRSATRASDDAMIVEQKRAALADLDATEFYAHGCDENSVFVIPADEDTEADAADDASTTPDDATLSSSDDSTVPSVAIADVPEEKEQDVTAAEARIIDTLDNTTVEDILSRSTESSKEETVEPIEETTDAFSIWESESDKGETETPDAEEDRSTTEGS